MVGVVGLVGTVFGCCGADEGGVGAPPTGCGVVIKFLNVSISPAVCWVLGPGLAGCCIGDVDAIGAVAASISGVVDPESSSKSFIVLIQ